MEKITIIIESPGLSINDVSDLIEKLPSNQHEIKVFSKSGQKIHAKTPKYTNHLVEFIHYEISQKYNVENLRVWVKKDWV